MSNREYGCNMFEVLDPGVPRYVRLTFLGAWAAMTALLSWALWRPLGGWPVSRWLTFPATVAFLAWDIWGLLWAASHTGAGVVFWHLLRWAFEGVRPDLHFRSIGVPAPARGGGEGDDGGGEADGDPE